MCQHVKAKRKIKVNFQSHFSRRDVRDWIFAPIAEMLVLNRERGRPWGNRLCPTPCIASCLSSVTLSLVNSSSNRSGERASARFCLKRHNAGPTVLTELLQL